MKGDAVLTGALKRHIIQASTGADRAPGLGSRVSGSGLGRAGGLSRMRMPLRDGGERI